jgi:hypothetical protein
MKHFNILGLVFVNTRQFSYLLLLVSFILLNLLIDIGSLFL